MTWPTGRQPFGVNHATLLSGLASDGTVEVPIAVDRATGEVLVSTSGGGLPTAGVNGGQIVTTSAVALPSGALTQGVVLESLSTNGVSIFVGYSNTVTTSGSTMGIEVLPGGNMGAAISNTNKIYVICASGSPVLTWLGS
jgi:hypothetical protein